MEYLTGQVEKLLKIGKIDEQRKIKVFAKEKQNLEANIKDMETLEKLNKDIAIIIPTYCGQKPWLRACLESVKKLGYFVLLAYDNHFWSKQTVGHIFPSPKVMMMADAMSMKHQTHITNLGISYLWDMLYGLRLLRGFGFPYVFSINGDCIMEKPENFPQIIEMMGDADIICCEYTPEHRSCGTFAMLAKMDMFCGYFDQFVQEQFVHKGSLEKMLYAYIEENNYKIAPVKNSAHKYKMPDHNADWSRIVGLRHLHAEHVVRREDRLLPVEQEYFDFGKQFENIKEDSPLHKYYKTGDIQHLEQWWTPLT